MHLHPQPAPCRPFLKWAGGKQRTLSAIKAHLPPGKRLIEPFLGAGAVFLGTDYPEAILGDANLDLIAAWTAIKERPREFVDASSALFVEANRSPEAYSRIRAEYNGATDSFERAIRFIYLNKLGFNGVYRVNRKGVFNVPYGKPASLPLFPHDDIAAAHEKLRCATLLPGGFEATMSFAGEGDVVYCDPPYDDLPDAKSFVAYTAEGFGRRDHERLAAAALAAADRGSTVLISNHLSEFTTALYGQFELITLSTARTVAASRAHRRNVSEVLAIARPGRSTGGDGDPAAM